MQRDANGNEGSEAPAPRHASVAKPGGHAEKQELDRIRSDRVEMVVDRELGESRAQLAARRRGLVGALASMILEELGRKCS